MILKIKGRGFFISDYWPVYMMPGSSRFHKFDHLERNFFFNLRFHHKKLVVEFFLEYLHPKHADLMINMQVKLKHRTDFYTNDVFMQNMMTDIEHYAIMAINRGFMKHNIRVPAIEASPEFVTGMISDVKHEAPLLMDDWKAMSRFVEGYVFKMGRGTAREILLRVTFAVLDEVFLSNPGCNRMHNRTMLEEHADMSLSDYLMMRITCNQRTWGKIGFSPLQAVRLFQLHDCAAQILTGRMYDKIAPELDYMGISKKNVHKYLAEVDKFSKQARSVVNKFAGKNFRSLVPYKNWDKVLR